MPTDSYEDGDPRRRALEIDRTPLTIMLLLAAVAAVQFIHHYPNMPDVLATHFGVSGAADGWSSKTSFFVTYGIIECVMIVGAFLVARFASRIPTGALSIPNRDYWLAPERRAESLRFVWNQVLWLAVATLAFLMAVAEIVFLANLGPGEPALSRDFLIAIVAFVAVTGWISVRILARFRMPAQE